MGIFGWLKPEEEPDDRTLGEISNDEGDHVVFDVPTKKEGSVRRIMRENKVELDRDDQLSRRYDAAKKVEKRDSGQHRYRMDKVVDRSEDSEPEEDNDVIEERNEQEASGGWWPFG